MRFGPFILFIKKEQRGRDAAGEGAGGPRGGDRPRRPEGGGGAHRPRDAGGRRAGHGGLTLNR